MKLKCLKCGKKYAMSENTMRETGYTRYSYCEECLQKALKASESIEEMLEELIDRKSRYLDSNMLASAYAISGAIEIVKRNTMR